MSSSRPAPKSEKVVYHDDDDDDDDNDDANKCGRRSTGGNGKPPPPPPPALAILAIYLVLGLILSYGFGRIPNGSLPPRGLLAELAPSAIVVSIFLLYYEVADCLGTGLAKATYAHGSAGRTYQEYATQWCSVPQPEPVYLADRAQTNQMEQFPVFFVGTIGCAVYVNGIVAAVLATLWISLRIQYSQTYRASIGVTQDVLFRRIGTYTIPAYFVANAMVAATAIHALRTCFAL